MKLIVTYMNGRSETFENVSDITAIKDAKGKTEGIVVDAFNRVCRLEPRRETEFRGIKSMELIFN